MRILAILTLSLALNLCLLLLCFSQHQKNIVCSYFFRIILTACGIKVHARGATTEKKQHTRTLIVANHVSYLDVLIINSLFPCVFLAKSEVGQWPVFGWVARSLGCVFVHRDSLMGRAAALRKSLRKLTNSNLVIFPEGTTTASDNPEFTRWTKGHAWIAKRALAEQILCLKLTFENQSQRAWTDDMALLPHLFATLQEEETHVTVSAKWSSVALSANVTDVATQTWANVCAASQYAST
jgi:1-acyl-sn-glycerol-3-phosphate acyltransferase